MLQQELRQTQTQRVDPRIIQTNSVLQYTGQELLQAVEVELQENPALALEEEESCSGDCVDASSCPVCSALRSAAASEGSPLDLRDQDIDIDLIYDLSPSDYEAEEYDPFGNIESEKTLSDHLSEQLRVMPLNTSLRAIGQYIIENLNSRGWLEYSVEVIASELCVATTEVCSALTQVQSLDPPGIAARNLRECLLLQLDSLIETVEQKSHTLALAHLLVSEYWEFLRTDDIRRISRNTGASVAEIAVAQAFIRENLSPSPADQFRSPWDHLSNSRGEIVRPDVVIHRTPNGFELDVLVGELPSLVISSAYRRALLLDHALQSTNPLLEKRQIASYVSRAESFIQNISFRRSLLKRISKAIIERQIGFLETGQKQFMRTITRTQIAKALDLHDSMVSRALNNKYVQLPNQEVVSFSIFFDHTISIEETIKATFESESHSTPLSDEQVASILKGKGISLSRRGVANYRNRLRIPPAARRARQSAVMAGNKSR